MLYDGIVFGNGMTLNLLYKLKSQIPDNKHYLLDINDFLKQWIKGGLTQREERIFYSAIYGNRKDKWIFFDRLKDDFARYYEKYDADIEFYLGKMLFDESEYKDILSFFPAVYNIWSIILREQLYYLELANQIEKYYESVRNIVDIPQNVWTTNFDLFAETLKPKHLHGRFLSQMKQYDDVIYKRFDNGKQYYYKYIWGHNGIGKANNIKQLMQFPDYKNYFDFEFFFDNNIRMEKLLIYGMGFRSSGYIEGLKSSFPRYERAVSGGIIDEHILWRINGLQSMGLLKNVEITYFSEKEKEHLKEVLEATQISNWKLMRCQDIDFSIS